MSPKQNNQEFSSATINRRPRRHWYDNEKLDIIKRFDNSELPRVKGKPLYVTDPYSGDDLPIQLIERWRDTFRGLGILGKKPSEGTPNTFVRARKEKEGVLEELEIAFLEVMQENQRLKKMVDILERRVLNSVSPMR